jgi:hypothetical protein
MRTAAIAEFGVEASCPELDATRTALRAAGRSDVNDLG